MTELSCVWIALDSVLRTATTAIVITARTTAYSAMVWPASSRMRFRYCTLHLRWKDAPRAVGGTDRPTPYDEHVESYLGRISGKLEGLRAQIPRLGDRRVWFPRPWGRSSTGRPSPRPCGPI